MDSTSKNKIILETIYDHQELSHSIEDDLDQPLLEHLNRLNIPIDQSCGGFGTCGTCKITVLYNAQNLSPRNDIENDMSLDRGFEENERLSCQTYMKGSVKISI